MHLCTRIASLYVTNCWIGNQCSDLRVLRKPVTSLVAPLFSLRTTVVVIVVITVFIAHFLYCTFKVYSAIRLSSHKCVINSVFSVHPYLNILNKFYYLVNI